MIRNVFIVGAVAIAMLAGCSSNSSSALPSTSSLVTPTVTTTITSGITASAALEQAATGPDGRVWFSEFNGNKVAAVNAAGVVTEYPTGAGSQPLAIIVGPDSNIWTGGYGGGVSKITAAGVVTPYALAGSHIAELTTGADFNMWFADYGNNKIGKVTTAGVITEYPMPGGDEPCGITSGSDGNLWVTDCTVGAIVKFSTAGAVLANYSLGSVGPNAEYILGGTDGALYYAISYNAAATVDAIGRITTAGTITTLPLAQSLSGPSQLTQGKDGNLYFTEFRRSNIGRVNIGSQTITETALTLPATGTDGIANGPGGQLWVSGFQQIYAVNY